MALCEAGPPQPTPVMARHDLDRAGSFGSVARVRAESGEVRIALRGQKLAARTTTMAASR